MMRSRSVVWTPVLIAALFATTITVTASASHPTQICLDVEPEVAAPASDDDIADTLSAFPGGTDAGHPPEHERCVTEMVEPGQDWGGTNVDFEISGPADPDGSDTPLTPDMTCTITDGSASCAVAPPQRANSAGGNNTIRAWIDFDLNDSTTEADMSEGPREDSHPGDTTEFDATDVTDWMWTACHCRPPPCDAPPCPSPTTVTIDYRSRTGAFRGEVRSRYRRCEDDRLVVLRKARPGEDRFKAKTRAGSDGTWVLEGFAGATGRHYVEVGRTVIHNERAEAVIECSHDRSPGIKPD